MNYILACFEVKNFSNKAARFNHEYELLTLILLTLSIGTGFFVTSLFSEVSTVPNELRK